MRYDGTCPICDSFALEKVYQDEGDNWIEQVLLCDEHELVVAWGDPIVEEIRDSEGERIPREEWE